jgi:hypothetical protein
MSKALQKTKSAVVGRALLGRKKKGNARGRSVFGEEEARRSPRCHNHDAFLALVRLLKARSLADSGQR